MKQVGLWLSAVFGAAMVATGCVGGNCNDDSECGAGFTCVDWSCQPQAPSCEGGRQECTDSAQCASNLCEKGCCAAPCASRLECKNDEQCMAGVCRKEVIEEGCKADTDCRGDVPFCQKETGLCVGCLDDSQCRDLHVCGFGNKCQRDTTRCSVDGDCGKHMECVNQKCEQVGCSTNGDCSAPTPMCRTADRACVECLAKSDCAPDHDCKANACEPVYCDSNASCGSDAPVCDASGTRLCVECLANADCRLGEVCEDKACVPNPIIDMPCSMDGDCFDLDTNGIYGLRCIKDRGETSGRCKADCDYYREYLPGQVSKCPKNMACARTGWSSGKPLAACMPASVADADIGEECSGEVACRTGLECVPTGSATGVCRKPCNPKVPNTGCPGPAGSCREMVESDGANRPQVYGLCYSVSKYLDRCETSADCDDWQVCAKGLNRKDPTRSANTCRLPAGTTKNFGGCNEDAECESGFCVSFNVGNDSGFVGHCQQACTGDSQCGAADGAACAKVTVEVRDAAGELQSDTVNSCVPLCDGASDCSTDPAAMCRLQSNVEETRWINRCAPKLAADLLKGGGHCTADEQCQSGTCLFFGSNTDGICLGACSQNKDCEGYKGAGWVNGCEDLLASGQPDKRCVSTCSMSAQQGQHGGGVLLYRDRNGAADQNVVGLPAISSNQVAPICWGASCSSTKDCEIEPSMGQRVCLPTVNPADPTGKPLFHCAPAFGTVTDGNICQADADCASGQCIDWAALSGDGTQPKRCYGTCFLTIDCPIGTSCKPATWPAGSTVQHRVCVPNGVTPP